jgi:hypothetical protein
MKKRKVIDVDNLPARIPGLSTLIIAIALDHWAAPEWVWGVAGVFVLAKWLVFFATIRKEEGVDIFEDKPPLIDQFEEMSKFNQKLQELLDKNKKKANESN